jgi:hypothetical protein
MDDKKVVDEQQLPTPANLTPGQTISPRQENTQELPAQPTAQIETTLPPVASAETPQPTEAVPTPQSAPDEGSFEEEPALETEIENMQPVSWSASEFVAHHKNSGWYLLLILGAVVVAALVYVFTRDWLSTAVVVVAGTVLAAYSSRKPRQLNYAVDGRGVTVGTKFFAYSEFRSFSIVPEGAFASIVFMPLKRFGIQTTIYYDPQDEDRIIDVISPHLPHEEHQADMLDHMMRRIRFY